MGLSHSELCYETAKHYVNKYHIALWEYQSFSTPEFPDVLCFKDHSVLFEIKTSKYDFLADKKKEARIKYKVTNYSHIQTDLERIKKQISNGELVLESNKVAYKIKHIEAYLSSHSDLKKFYIEKPHLGSFRYFVIEGEFINVDELPIGWGLIYYRNGRFKVAKESDQFRPNLFYERSILTHALRQYANNGDNKNHILIKGY